MIDLGVAHSICKAEGSRDCSVSFTVVVNGSACGALYLW